MVAEQPMARAWYLSAIAGGHQAMEIEGYENLGVYPGMLKMAVGKWELEVHADRSGPIDDLPAFLVRLTYNGWPAGVIGPDGGLVANSADGSFVGEDDLIQALEEHLAALGIDPDAIQSEEELQE